MNLIKDIDICLYNFLWAMVIGGVWRVYKPKYYTQPQNPNSNTPTQEQLLLMKMEVQQKLIIRSLYFLFGIAVSLQFLQCNESNIKGDIGYGKSFFMENCSSCHQRNEGYNGVPSLLVLNDYDSLSLFNKLSNIKQDSIHGNYFKNLKYSNKEANSIYEYIKHTFEPHY